MKISILTFSKEYNYGANLQCYALCRVLANMGHDVDIIDAQLAPIQSSFITKAIRLPSAIGFKRFRDKFLSPFTLRYATLNELMANPPQSDVFVVGSDQVWNPDITKRFHPLAYFLPFVSTEKKRIAYAASIGVTEWTHKELNTEIRQELEKFTAVGLRESSGVDICRREFHIDAETVLDPTLLLSSYDEICGCYDKNRKSKELVLFKFVKNACCESICLDIANSHGLSPVYLAYKHPAKGFKFCPNASVSQWLNRIRYADFVVTDSFHCLVFCILFHKKFAVLPSFEGRSGRMENLLDLLGISDRFCNNAEEFRRKKDKLYGYMIDYDNLDIILSRLRESSFRFIQNALTK